MKNAWLPPEMSFKTNDNIADIISKHRHVPTKMFYSTRQSLKQSWFFSRGETLKHQYENDQIYQHVCIATQRLIRFLLTCFSSKVLLLFEDNETKRWRCVWCHASSSYTSQPPPPLCFQLIPAPSFSPEPGKFPRYLTFPVGVI